MVVFFPLYDCERNVIGEWTEHKGFHFSIRYGTNEYIVNKHPLNKKCGMSRGVVFETLGDAVKYIDKGGRL